VNANRLAIAGTVVLLGICSADAAAAIINFDDVDAQGSTRFARANQYRGVVFSRTIPIEDVSSVESPFYPAFVGQGGTLRNGLALNQGIGVLSLDLDFEVPTNRVSVRVFDTEVGTVLGTLQAFDVNGLLLDTATLITPDSQSAVLSVQGSGIARVRFSVDSDGAVFDNLYFGSRAVPEPATWGLVVLGALILSLRGRLARRVTSNSPN
jgi:hypothetical protein